MEKVNEEFEITRYKDLPWLLQVFVLTSTVAGVGVGIFFVFGLTFMGRGLLDVGFYYLVIALFLPCVFLLLPARKKDKEIPWYDLAAASCTFGIPIYFLLHSWEISQVGWIPPSTFNFLLGLILCLSLLESARRGGGLVFFAVCILFGVYPLVADRMPGVFFGTGFSFVDVIGSYTFGREGILGVPIKVMTQILIGFLLLTGFLLGTGAGKFFLDIALSLLGRYRGGVAKVAVLSSALFGGLSGSCVSNVVATGSFTIPAMKRTGYAPHYAGAVEACASTGGILMPPVMGVIAFVMCAFLGIQYEVVIKAAIMPALLYYWGLLLQADLYAAKSGLGGLPQEEIPPLKKVLIRSWPVIIVLLFLMWGFLYMKWEWVTPYYATALLFLLSFHSRETAMTPRKTINALVVIAELLVRSMAILLPVSLIMCALIITGVSSSLTSSLIFLGGGNIYLLLLMGAIACYLMGMAGLVTAAYIFLAVTLAPAIVAASPGTNILAIHMFILYYTTLAVITPPVAISAFVAAAIAGADPMKTSLQSMRLGVVVYFIPFYFVFNPALILQGPILEGVYLFLLNMLGIALLAVGLEGYLWRVGTVKGFLVRAFLFLAGLLISFPEPITTIIGVILASFAMTILLIRKKSIIDSEERERNATV